MKRRLSAILVADAVGYSRLMERDEESTVRSLGAYRKAITSLVTQRDGHVFGSAGDNVIAEFASAVEAVRCAVSIQQLDISDSSETESTPMQFRIGINLGDVVVDDNNLLGDGVNIAARLESLAEVGGITISRSVYDQVKKVVPVKYESLGLQQVKNIEDPVEIFRILMDESGQKREETAFPGNEANIHSIAVLPFVNMSGDSEQDYFSDGISEDLITALSYFKAFPVIARNSTFTYKGKSVGALQIADELGARYLIEGSVRKSGNRVRITAQLVDGKSGHHLWADRFDRTLEDIFDVQDEITQKIVSIIQPQLTRVELERSTVKRPENLTAWDFVLRGTALYYRQSRDDYEAARQAFQSAIDIDQNYTEAWSGLAWTYLGDMILMAPDERPEILKEGMKAAQRAVELDEQSYFAHYVLGAAYTWAEQYGQGISERGVALQLNPYHAQSHMGLGNSLDLDGRTREGIDRMEQGIRLSPVDPFKPIILAYLSRAYLSLEKPDTALEYIEQAVNLQPENPVMQYRYAICLAHLDQVEEAKHVLEKCDRLQPGFLAQRKGWKPYPDAERNRRFFAGIARHALLPESHYHV